ncbi:hypothetical protein QJS10_CPB11g00850 [Acorus calamus]|uniref:Uncharacterized protein n=1 Tax=Acorus calamus TaxID=4465 RepID=A0AAV9DV85_ACOCL|nr:hypothetical protein QJS10_CPB11g00850 [Acorus calamus]
MQEEFAFEGPDSAIVRGVNVVFGCGSNNVFKSPGATVSTCLVLSIADCSRFTKYATELLVLVSQSGGTVAYLLFIG